MTTAGWIVIIIGVLVLGVVAWVMLRRPREEPTTETAERPTGGGVAIEPPVRSVTVEDDRVVVDFDVPLPKDADERLTRLLTSAAIESVRREGLDLESKRVTAVVARAGRGAATEVGRVELEQGKLPPPQPPQAVVEVLGGAGPLLSHAADLKEAGPTRFGPDELAPIGLELDLDPEIATALHAQGIDPGEDDAPELVRAVLRLAGYTVDEVDERTHLARKAGETVLVRSVPHGEGQHPELEDGDVSSFLVAIGSAPTDEAILVTAKLVPFHLYGKERDGVRIIGRQRLPSFVRSLLGGPAG